MKISCLRSDLATAISNVSRAVSTKASIPALEGVLIKAYGNTLNISGYNLEIGITTDIEATIKEEGEIVVSAKLFLDIVRRLPEEIVFIETDEFKHLVLSFSRNNKTVFAFAVYIFTANCHSVTVNGNNFEYTVLNFVK